MNNNFDIIKELKKDFWNKAAQRDFKAMSEIYEEISRRQDPDNAKQIFFSEMAEKTIKLPNEVIRHIQGLGKQLLYILKNDYFAIYQTEYTKEMADVLKTDAKEVTPYSLSDSFKPSAAAVRALKLENGDIVKFTLFHGGVFADKL